MLGLGFLTQLIPYYMVFGIILLFVGARVEINAGIRLGLKLGQQY